MNRFLVRAASLHVADWLLLARAGVVVTTARLALWASGAQGARRVTRIASRLVGRCDAGRAAWAVSCASRVVPAASCLTQALALQALFEQAGRPCRVEIGVSNEKTFEAHAWVVSGDEIVLGAAGVARFERVATLD